MILLHNRLAVLPIKSEQKTQSGIILSEKQQIGNKGIIQLIGNKVKHLKVGQTVMYHDHVGVNIDYRGDSLVILSESTDIIAVL